MDQDFAARLRGMTTREMAKEFLPLLTRDKISKTDYDLYLSMAKDFGKEASGNGPADVIAQQFGGRVVDDGPVVKISTQERPDGGNACPTITPAPSAQQDAPQKERLLELLLDGEWHDTPEIQRAVYGANHLGSAAIPSRVSELRKEGFRIESEKKAGAIWHYRLSPATV